VGTTAFGGSGVTVWGCFSLNCKLVFLTSILGLLVVPHFDGHPLASRPILMDDNAKPHRPI